MGRSVKGAVGFWTSLVAGVCMGGSLLFASPTSAHVEGTIEQIDAGDPRDKVVALNRSGAIVTTATEYTSTGTTLSIALILPNSTAAIPLAQYDESTLLGALQLNDRNEVHWGVTYISRQPQTRESFLAINNGTEIIQLPGAGVLNNQGYVAWIESDGTNTFLRLRDPNDGSVSTLASSGPFEMSFDMNDRNDIVLCQRKVDGIGYPENQDQDVHVMYGADPQQKTTITLRDWVNPIDPIRCSNPVINEVGIAAWVMRYDVRSNSDPVATLELRV